MDDIDVYYINSVLPYGEDTIVINTYKLPGNRYNTEIKIADKTMDKLTADPKEALDNHLLAIGIVEKLND